MNLAARLQLALSPWNAEDRRSAARERILRAGFWLSPSERPSAEIRQLHPVVATRRAPTLNP